MIPNTYHFVWFGTRFSFSNALSIYSLYGASPDACIVLHASDDLSGQQHFDELVRRVPQLRVRVNPISALTDGLPDELRASLGPVCAGLEANQDWGPLSDVARYAALYREGGVYLDFDTLTVRDPAPLRAAPAFCGREVLVVTAETFRRGGWLRYFRTTPLNLMRAVCARAEPGYRWFSRIEPLYPTAVNNAVLGAVPRHPLIAEALSRVSELIPRLARRRSSIGPDLLDDLLAGNGFPDVVVHPPSRFYPLGPTMAVHLSRQRDDVHEAFETVVSPETYVVHWYNDQQGDRTLPRDPEETHALARRQVFARLAEPGLIHVGL